MKDIDCPDCGGIHAPNSRDCPADRDDDLADDVRQLQLDAQAEAEPPELSGRGWELWFE